MADMPPDEEKASKDERKKRRYEEVGVEEHSLRFSMSAVAKACGPHSVSGDPSRSGAGCRIGLVGEVEYGQGSTTVADVRRRLDHRGFDTTRATDGELRSILAPEASDLQELAGSCM